MRHQIPSTKNFFIIVVVAVAVNLKVRGICHKLSINYITINYKLSINILSNTIIFSGNKDVNGRFIHIPEKPVHTNNHLHTSPTKHWISTIPLMVPGSNRRVKMRKSCTINNSAKGRPINVNIIPD